MAIAAEKKLLTLEQCEALLREAPNRLALLRAWLGWRGQGVLPALADVRPEDIGRALSCMIVLEVEARDRIMIRLAGTQFLDVLGREITGENFVDLAPPAQRETRMEHYSNYVSYPCGVIWSADMVRASGYRTSVKGVALSVGAPGDSIRMYAAFDFIRDTKDFEKEPLNAIPAASEIEYVDIGFGAPG